MKTTRFHNAFEYFRILAGKSSNDLKKIDSWKNSISNQTEFYLDAFRFYYFNLPAALQKQKRYFRKKSRGFGENAFHTMWYLLYEKYRFSNFLEIGVYRGQIMHLVGLLAKQKKSHVEIYGISPFDNSGDSESKYMEIDYQKDVLSHFEKFSLKKPNLLKAFSTDSVALDLISSRLWDCIYIDGSHDIEIVERDWNVSKEHIKVGGIIVFDDASLNTHYQPPFFAFAGHPGPSKVSDRIAIEQTDFREVLRVGHNRVFERLR